MRVAIPGMYVDNSNTYIVLLLLHVKWEMENKNGL